MSDQLPADAIFHLNGGPLSLHFLEIILESLNRNGQVKIIGASESNQSSVMDIFGPFVEKHFKVTLKKQ